MSRYDLTCPDCGESLWVKSHYNILPVTGREAKWCKCWTCKWTGFVYPREEGK